MDLIVFLKSLVMVCPLTWKSTSVEGLSGTIGFCCRCFNPRDARASASMFSSVPRSYFLLVRGLLSWWLRTHWRIGLLRKTLRALCSVDICPTLEVEPYSVPLLDIHQGLGVCRSYFCYLCKEGSCFQWLVLYWRLHHNVPLGGDEANSCKECTDFCQDW